MKLILSFKERNLKECSIIVRIDDELDVRVKVLNKNDLSKGWISRDVNRVKNISRILRMRNGKDWIMWSDWDDTRK